MNQDEIKKSIETVMDPALKQVLTRVMNRVQNTPLAEEVTEFKQEILKTSIKDKQKIFSFLPHQMAKTSIFFPMSDRELKEENRRISKIEHETGWGKVVIEGVKLAIFEEDIFLALMTIAKSNIKKLKDEYILETNMKNVVNLLYGSSSYTKKTYARIETALQHFQLVRFELTTYDWKKKGKEREKTAYIRSIGNIVQSYQYNKKDKNLIIKFNPGFFAYFLESMLTNINLSIRRNLKKDGSKALLRFLSTHNNPGKMHMLTVLNAINYNINQPMFKLRQLFKSFIHELKKQNVLGTKSKLYNGDIVTFDIGVDKKALPK